jgi:hypothetical protein
MAGNRTSSRTEFDAELTSINIVSAASDGSATAAVGRVNPECKVLSIECLDRYSGIAFWLKKQE